MEMAAASDAWTSDLAGQYVSSLLLLQVVQTHAVCFQHRAKILLGVAVFIVHILVDVKLAVFQHNRFITKLNGNSIFQLKNLSLSWVLQASVHAFRGEFCMR